MSNSGKTQPLESFLNPAILRANLIVVSLYIAAFEVLHDSIVERLRGFYASSYDKNFKPVIGQDYETEVLQGRKKLMPASLGSRFKARTPRRPIMCSIPQESKFSPLKTDS